MNFSAFPVGTGLGGRAWPAGVGRRRWRALGLVSAALLLAPVGPGASAPGLSVGRPCAAQSYTKGSYKSKDYTSSIRESLPLVWRGGALVLGATLAVMVLLLGPLGWLRKTLSRNVALSGPSSFPSGRRHYVKIGGLGVPLEFQWQFPVLVVSGNRLDMRMARRVKGEKDTWALEDGTRIEFVVKSEVDAERERREMERRTAREDAHAWRRFDDQPEGEEPRR